MIFTYGWLKIEVQHEYVYYATYIASEYDFLKVWMDGIVLDVGVFVSGFIVKIAKKANEVVVLEPLL